ncbi:hypothetical protein ACFTY8_43035 [Streptomyces mirabilis]|uniref:hypothetical protein n=1 Tax=Streptomyces mirabilis TaxID=68239 RepID=UPI00363CE751
MGLLFEELEAREAAARVRVEELEAELVSVSGKLELAREGLERLRITRETVAEVQAAMTRGGRWRPSMPGGRLLVSRGRRRTRGASGRSSGC